VKPSDPPRSSDDLFDAIATLLEPGQREYFYQRMLYFRQLRPDDELLRIVEAIGFLALIIRSAPDAVAIERQRLAQLLATHLATMGATATADQAYRQQLDDRLTRLPAEIAAGISPPAIAEAITESLRHRRRRQSVKIHSSPQWSWHAHLVGLLETGVCCRCSSRQRPS
jgi:hypothetical protein